MGDARAYPHDWTGTVTPDGDRWRAVLSHPVWPSHDGGGARHATEALAWKWCDECAPLADTHDRHLPCAPAPRSEWCGSRWRWCFARPVTPREVCA